MFEFNKILKKITNGENVEQQLIVPLLTVSSKKQRSKLNLLLALAYFQQNNHRANEQAAVFIKRAWNLSGFDEEIFRLFEKIHISLDRIDEIKEAYKRLFIKYADSNELEKAGKYFNLWQSAYSIYKHLDKYEYDYDIINKMTQISEKFKIIQKHDDRKDKKRIAYFVTGLTEINSVLLKIDMLFAEYYNKENYVTAFFSLDTADEISDSQQGKIHLETLKKLNVDLFTPECLKDRVEKIISLANKIYDYNPDLIVSDVALRDFDHYLFSLVVSNYKQLCFNQGPPPQFIPPHVNWNISWTKHPLIDSPVDGSLIPLEFESFAVDKITSKTKSELNVPEDSVLIVAAGRTQKFQNTDFWNCVGKILKQSKNAHLIVVGMLKENAPDFSSFVDSDSHNRIRFFGWQSDYLQIMKSADLVLDTFPSGGGVVIIDAMVMSKPVLFFSNDYMHEYDQTNWSPAEELVVIPELTVPRDNLDEYIKRAVDIINNKELRIELGVKCGNNIRSHKGNPSRMVRRCEEIYDAVISGNNTGDCENDSIDEFEDLEIRRHILAIDNYYEWQKAFMNGYRSNMGNHADYFYNKSLVGIGLYDCIEKANSIIEYGSSDSIFMDNFITRYPEKKFYLSEYSTELINQLKNKYTNFSNIEVILNYPEQFGLTNIDLSFSFLLVQSMPKTLFINHLKNVKSMLSEKGCYIFQFAYHPEGYSDDLIQNGIYGNNKYKPEEIYKILEEAGFNGCDITSPITLENFNTDVVWYLCKAY